MRHSAIYRAAAELMERGGHCKQPNCGYSCCALSMVVPRDDNNLYFEVQRRYVLVFGDESWWNADMTPENQGARIAALRHMATLAEKEERDAA